jgi:hypothetical protein
MATIAPLGIYRAFDDNGEPLAGGKLYTYEAGTSTPKDTYTTAEGDVANSNPVELDASGYAQVWLGDGGYKFILTDAGDVVLFTTDNINGVSSDAFGGEVNLISSNTAITSVYANSVNIATNSPTLSLLPANSAGEGFYFSVKNEGLGVVTIDPDGSETIDGQSTKLLTPGQSALIITDGITWFSLFFADVTASGNNTFSGNTTFTGNVLYPDDGELTIAAGVITVTGVYHTVDTEGDAPTDDLVTINGGSDGQILILRTENDSRDVVIKTTGNIATGGVNDITLGNSNTQIVLQYDTAKTKWLVQSANAAQGALADTALQPTGSGANLTGVSKLSVAPIQASTSGTSIDFNSIPAGTKRITVSLNGVSTNGTSNIQLQLGDSGGVEPTGYLGTTMEISTSTPLATLFTTGIGFRTGATAVHHGCIELSLVDAATNLWSAILDVGQSNAAVASSGGYTKALSATLDRIRLTTVNGTDTFDAGSIGAMYEIQT